MSLEKTYLIGTSNIMLPVAKKNFPEAFADKSRLQYYAGIFSTVEVNSSFYKLPMAGTIGRWANEVSEAFKFSFKLSRAISHSKNLGFDPDDVKKFMLAVKHAASNKGCILIQFPEGLTAIHHTALAMLLGEMRKYDINMEWQLAVDFRHNSWYSEETAELLEGFSAIPVIHDMPKTSKQFFQQGISGPRYYRFHGTLSNYRGEYTSEILSAYAREMTATINNGYPVYAYFNNSLGNAFGDAVKLQQLVSSDP